MSIAIPDVSNHSQDLERKRAVSYKYMNMHSSIHSMARFGGELIGLLPLCSFSDETAAARQSHAPTGSPQFHGSQVRNQRLVSKCLRCICDLSSLYLHTMGSGGLGFVEKP
jgi:hypothetical protein